MAAFASFHIGERLRLWRWQADEVSNFSLAEEEKSESLEDDFQIIRSINNKIFADLGWVHRAFNQAAYESFQSMLAKEKRHQLIINAFAKLHQAREGLKTEGPSHAVNDLIWQANSEILWHEQSRVVQPAFDKLSEFFQSAMTLFASFDYNINHRQTNWQTRSKFILFMLLRGLWFIRKDGFIPDVAKLHHRWYWITHDLLKKWRKAETKKRKRKLIHKEIKFLAGLEPKNPW